MRKLGRMTLALTLLGITAVGLPRAAVVHAQSLNPPPLPFMVCNATGSGTICMGRSPLDDEFIIAAQDNPCGFDIDFHIVGTLSATFWYDQNGNGVKQFFHAPATVTLSANGRSLMSLNISYAHIDFVTGTVKLTGEQFVWKIPGQQPIISAGQVLIDLNTGEVIVQHGTFSDAITPAMCTYLSGN